ncbi:MAG: DUF1275 domain-containing protein [Xanthomonadaceae bacterium]|nr:DUF1275 domain-containing protein [Xanthomonadaceae bacterium]
MYRLERKQLLEVPKIIVWSVFGFQAGFLNAFGFLAFGSFVSHVTGVGTQIGMAVGSNSLWYELELLGFPFSFIFGAFVSGLFTSVRLERGLKPQYTQVLFIIPLGLLVMFLLGSRGVFGTFGEGLLVWHDFVLMYFLSFICGIQNGCIAVLTGGQIRTTHLTGLSTDIGTDLSRVLFGKLNKTENQLTKKINYSRLATFFSFTLGSVFSVIETKRLQFEALWIPLFTSLILAVAMMQIRRKLYRVFSN